jgi:hypothetical protein
MTERLTLEVPFKPERTVVGRALRTLLRPFWRRTSVVTIEVGEHGAIDAIKSMELAAAAWDNVRSTFPDIVTEPAKAVTMVLANLTMEAWLDTELLMHMTGIRDRAFWRSAVTTRQRTAIAAAYQRCNPQLEMLQRQLEMSSRLLAAAVTPQAAAPSTEEAAVEEPGVQEMREELVDHG